MEVRTLVETRHKMPMEKPLHSFNQNLIPHKVGLPTRQANWVTCPGHVQNV